jgi:hypothetical protein
MSTLANQADQEVTPQAKHKLKHIKEDEERKKDPSVVLERYLFILSDHHHPKGGKIRLCTRTKTGVHSIYLGREKLNKDLIAKYQKEGLRVQR